MRRRDPAGRQTVKMSGETCVNCGKALTNDDIAITKKLVNRGAEEFFCVPCLAERFKITVPDVEKLIENFKAAGCALFR